MWGRFRVGLGVGLGFRVWGLGLVLAWFRVGLDEWI